jgi:cation/acetate symporter
MSAQAYKDIYGWDPALARVPFSQPAIVSIPLGFIVLIVTSLLTAPKTVGAAFVAQKQTVAAG